MMPHPPCQVETDILEKEPVKPNIYAHIGIYIQHFHFPIHLFQLT